MTLTGNQVRSFQLLILDWWEKNKRDLPWRKTRDPYQILVSEMMLQQTQVSRVLPTYIAFLSRFPDVFALAGASMADVLIAWKGMGYNRRALYLQRTAVTVVQEHGGVFPHDEESLRKLPGLGKYTVRAIMVFAYEQNVSVIDTNVRRILEYYFFSGSKPEQKELESVADQLVPLGNSWSWHQALMDYGALEMPKIVPRKRAGAASQIPFKETSRFYRGRVVDVLRERPIEQSQLVHDFSAEYGKSSEYIEDIINGLARDGLLFRDTDGIISLPK